MGFAEPSVSSKQSERFPPVLFAHRARLPQRQTDERRTAHRETHQGRISSAGAQHHLAGYAIGLLAAVYVQNLPPQMDLHGLASENQRFAGL